MITIEAKLARIDAVTFWLLLHVLATLARILFCVVRDVSGAIRHQFMKVRLKNLVFGHTFDSVSYNGETGHRPKRLKWRTARKVRLNSGATSYNAHYTSARKFRFCAIVGSHAYSCRSLSWLAADNALGFPRKAVLVDNRYYCGCCIFQIFR